MPNNPKIYLRYPQGSPLRSAILWAEREDQPVLAIVLVDEIGRLTAALAAALAK